MPKEHWLSGFKVTQKGRGCVMVASASFWEGAGHAQELLQLVIIDTVFPPPNDPLVDGSGLAHWRQKGSEPFQ
jgi:ATP-dependent DNA helicase DinG